MTAMSKHKLANIEGAMLGLAIGDALGFPVEFMSLGQIRSQFGPEGITDLHPTAGHPAGSYTDDTQMTLALARAIIARATQVRASSCTR
jgi:ADP-ribosyl-[dinitrogen reductase] hydrolase